jgi:hypothetical protein
MSFRTGLAAASVAGSLFLASAPPADAARVRYHFTADPGRAGCLKAPAAGQRLTLTGWQAYGCPPPRATQLVTFRHPCTGQPVTVPLALPDATPRMEYTRDRAIYNYGSDTVEVRFLSDGSAEVIYNSGFLRAP